VVVLVGVGLVWRGVEGPVEGWCFLEEDLEEVRWEEEGRDMVKDRSGSGLSSADGRQCSVEVLCGGVCGLEKVEQKISKYCLFSSLSLKGLAGGVGEGWTGGGWTGGGDGVLVWPA